MVVVVVIVVVGVCVWVGGEVDEYFKKVWIRNQLDVTFVLSFITPLQVAQHVSGNHVPIFRS